ncbi:MAG: glycine cleavage system aminomethyltransferase GcvT [Candidatus Competibacteraceae bacterium]|jgi:aminomethyltransferase|nr:glycine cleavage system aminomethyltransferase GcvT [Candidatus Competibacteraceae bacterium]
MAEKTPLFTHHVALGAKMVDFGGWDMPLHYGSQVHEHEQVRQNAGLFDVSHMARLDVTGPQAQDFLRYLLANDVARLYPGKALYSCMLNKAGGIVDDLIVYDRGEAGYRLVLNAATRDKDWDWMLKQARRFDTIVQERADLVMLAIQGPQAATRFTEVLDADKATLLHDLQPYHALETNDLFLARTGYTGEDGLEIILPADQAVTWWERLLAAGIQPCGLGARDTLRMEAGMNLYGNDMDENITPLMAGLDGTVAWEPADRDFIGRAALEKQRQEGVKQVRVGLVLEDRGVLRARQRVITPSGATGIITSGTFSPTLDRAIGLARVPVDIGEYCQVVIRNTYCDAHVVNPPFVRHGRCLIELSPV